MIAKWREERRVEWAGHHGINAYKCRECGGLTVTIDVDSGVTPALLACRATPGCNGMAVSSGYPASDPPPHIMAKLRWEWRLPKGFDYARLSPEMRQFIDDGGLELVPRTGRPSAYRTEAP